MTRTVVAIENQRTASAVCAALERAGIPVRFRCRTGAETIRAVRKMGGGVVICSFMLPDMSANELYENLCGTAGLIVAARPSQLELCESEKIARLSLPAMGAELAELAYGLLEADRARAEATAAKRTPEERMAVEQAKSLVMERDGITEAAAHRYLQRKSMDSGQPMAETARKIIETLGRPRSGTI